MNSPRISSRRSPRMDAQFLGYSRDSRDKLAAPVFRYRVGKNVIETSTTISARWRAGGARERQPCNRAVVRAQRAAEGRHGQRRQTRGPSLDLPAGKADATLRGSIAVAANAWKPAVSTAAYKRAPVVKAPATATLPAGYSIENYYPPKDNYGRDQLFEALGLVAHERRHYCRRAPAPRASGASSMANGACLPKACSTASVSSPKTARV